MIHLPRNRIKSILCVLGNADTFLEETVHLIDRHAEGVPEEDPADKISQHVYALTSQVCLTDSQRQV